jgi:hypothetical protein
MKAQMKKVEGPEGEAIGFVAPAASGRGWFPLDRQMKVLDGYNHPLSKAEAEESVLDDWVLEGLEEPVKPAPKAKRASRYVYVSNFPSHSSPGTFHKVKRSVESGDLSCDCKGWIFSGKREGGRTCRHVRETMARLSA